MSIFDEIPDFGGVPDGTYVGEVEDIEKGQTQEGSRLRYVVTLRVTEPKEFVDVPVPDYGFGGFVIGSDEDPGALNEETWKKSVGARRFKSLIKSTQVPLTVNENATPEEQFDEIVEAVKGCQVCFTVASTIDDGSFDPRFKGKRRIDMRYYPLGSRVPGVQSEAPAPSARPIPRPMAPAPARPPGPPRPRPTAPAARPAPTRSDTPSPPPARPAPRAAPSRLAPRGGGNSAPEPEAPAPAPARGKKPQLIECAECSAAGLDKTQMYPDGALVARAEFPGHIEAHGEE